MHCLHTHLNRHMNLINCQAYELNQIVETLNAVLDKTNDSLDTTNHVANGRKHSFC